LAAAPTVDAGVSQAIHTTQLPSGQSNERRLAPPTANKLAPRNVDQPATRASAPLRAPLSFGLPLTSLYTIASALVIVIGAFLIFAWLMRRMGRSTTAELPGDVVGVLGRVPLAGRQFAHLLRVGNKLVLVTLTPAGIETITEIADPVEVDRIVGMCQQYGSHSTTKAFEQVFRQLSRESAPGGLAGDSLPQTISSAAAAYRAHRGDTARA
jgi:flagellar biogenesis protein FliO